MASLVTGRRSHRKSKAGCLQCKKRKIKCDEGKPICRNCKVHGVTCSLASASTYTQYGHGVNSQRSSASAPGPECASPASEATSLQPTSSQSSLATFQADLAVFDLELLHHYMTATCYTLSRAPAAQAVWRDQVPRIAFTMPAVLHTLLAISALHLARSDQSKRASCIAHAQMHHNAAIHAMVPIVTSLAPENSPGMFLFASLTCIFACARPPEGTDFLVLFEHGQLSQWVRLFRGTKAIIDYGDSEFHTGVLAPIFANGSNLAARRRQAHALEQGQMYIWELRKMVCTKCSPDKSLLQIYQEALDGLCRTLAVAMKPGDERRLETADVFAWLLEVSSEYLELLRQEEPIALVIFAYFCVSVRQIEWMWWMEGLSGRLLKELHSALDEEYRSWLQWPQEQIAWSPDGDFRV
ncbi:transcriptional regulator family: Fungal Specific TF [Paecilomyces variotii]|nr:transcriptional regulator family: Fungal Specific TF [Paecilomyces variotii]KAJ9322086.1 transcriptional regulator family: Fungal Specific TF [Paecilomyces variotii]KAJ9331797.1 transcriptional regulator family: Fungal Specific TF [Paecilomyces variotii]